jgi:integrase
VKVAAVQDLEADVSEFNHKTSMSKVWLQFGPYTTSNIGPRNLARNAGFHRFRHSVGTFVNAETGNIKLAQKLLGHSRYETTDQDRKAAVAVEQAIFGESVRNVRENTNNKGSEVIN